MRDYKDKIEEQNTSIILELYMIIIELKNDIYNYIHIWNIKLFDINVQIKIKN